MVNTEMRLITFFAAKDGEAVYSQKKQDLELVLKKVGKTTRPFSKSLMSIQ